MNEQTSVEQFRAGYAAAIKSEAERETVRVAKTYFNEMSAICKTARVFIKEIAEIHAKTKAEAEAKVKS